MTASINDNLYPKRRHRTMFAAAVVALSVMLTGCAADDEPSPPEQRSTTESQSSEAPSDTAGEQQGNETLDPQVRETAPEIMIVGDKNAPNTIEIYEDFLCTHCAAFATSTEDELIKKYVESGKAKIHYRDLIVIDPKVSTQLAVYARAVALETGDYETIRNLLMENQADLFRGYRLDTELAVQLGEQAGANNAEQLLAAAADPENTVGVEASGKEGLDIGVRGTPTVVVNGKVVDDLDFQTPNIDKYLQ